MPRPKGKKGLRNFIDCNTSIKHMIMYVQDLNSFETTTFIVNFNF